MQKYILKIDGSPELINNLEESFSKYSDSFEIKQKEISEDRLYYSLSFENVASIVAIVSDVVMLAYFLHNQLQNKKKEFVKIKTPTKNIVIESSESLSIEEMLKIIKTLLK